MVDEHELLVHISTPATRQNDQLYRSLADAYLDFEPHQNHAEGSPQQDAPSQIVSPRVSDPTPPNKGSSFRESINTSILSTSKDSYGSFPSQLSSDGYSNGHIGASDYAVEDDFAPTSSRLARLERIHQNWKAQATPKSSAASKQRSIRDVPSSPEDADTAFIEDTQAAVQALQSQLQDSFSMTWKDTSEDGSDTYNVEQEVPLSPTEPVEGTTVITAGEPISSSVTSSPKVPKPAVGRYEIIGLEGVSEQLEDETPASPESHPKSGSVDPEQQESLRSDDALKPESTLAEEKASESNNNMDQVDDSSSRIDFTDYPELVQSPPPKTGVESPETWPSQVTPYLAAIKTQYPNRFKPIKTLRNPVGNERGYWLIDCSTWPAQAQKDLWDGVCEPLQDGRLGWTPSLYRENGTSETLGRVQVFNWGEMAEHMWLLMWLCSKGRIAGAGLQWMVGRDVILEME